MANIYLDYAATSRKHFDIIEKNMNILKEVYANPSSGHTLGKKNDRLVREGREKIAKTLNASSNEIIISPVSNLVNTWLNTVLLLSVPPELKIISLLLAFKVLAIFSRPSRTSLLFFFPRVWPLLGLA